jgi:hypothetical protein
VGGVGGVGRGVGGVGRGVGGVGRGVGQQIFHTKK